MSAKGGGSLATLLFSVPLAAIPLMAIFGVPQLAPVANLIEDDEDGDRDDGRRRPRSSDLDDRADLGEFSESASDAPFFDGDTGDGFEEADAGGRHDARDSDRRIAEGTDRRRRPEAMSEPWPPADEGRTDRGIPNGLHEDVSNWPDARVAESSALGGAEASEPASLTWPEAARELSERGIQNYHLEQGHNEQSFLFVCAFTPPDAANVMMRFEAESAEPLEAVQSVLDQIDGWQRQQSAGTR
jgi:hypothetical protein